MAFPVSAFLRLDPVRFYDREYEAVLSSMVALTLKHEAPIYEDVLVARIARAHGFQRSGDRIQRAVSKVVGRKYRKTQDDGRTVVWGENSPETVLVAYRKSQSEVRSHTDTPVAELASLALPYTCPISRRPGANVRSIWSWKAQPARTVTADLSVPARYEILALQL